MDVLRTSTLTYVSFGWNVAKNGGDSRETGGDSRETGRPVSQAPLLSPEGGIYRTPMGRPSRPLEASNNELQVLVRQGLDRQHAWALPLAKRTLDRPAGPVRNPEGGEEGKLGAGRLELCR